MATFPYNWTPEAHQMPVINNPARFKVIIWHRKAHKTTLAINELLRWAGAIKGTYWYVAPFLSQAKKIVWQDPEMLPKYCPPEIWDKRNNSEMYITFPNGSVLYVMGADNPESMRGPNPKGVVLDEWDDMKTEVWSGIIQPIMAANPNSWTWFTGTPKGVRDLFKKRQYALEKMANGDGGWYTTLLKASESGIIDADSLEEAKKTTTEAYFKQEYECEFLEGAGAFFKGIDNCIWSGKGEDTRIDPKKRYQIGIDWAKVNDYTVLTAVDLSNFKVQPQERFNQIDYNLQKARAEAYYLRYNRAKVYMDSTGVGEPLYDDLYPRVHGIEPYHFTEQSRSDLLNNLQILIAQGKIKIPNDETLLNELKAFQYMLSERSNSMGANRYRVKVGVPGDQHDDCVMSLALACWNLPKQTIDPKYNEEKALLKQFDAHRKKKSKKW